MRAIQQGLILMMFMLPLTGCLNVASTGAQAVYNHRSLQNSLNDQYISIQAYQRLNVKTQDFDNANIATSTYNSEVLMVGQVPEEWQKKKAEKIIKDIPGVTRVYNQLLIASPSSSLTKVSDAWITAKIKSKLIASNDVDASDVKVVTENGIVYMMGTLRPSEAIAAVDIASETRGVLGVVKIFLYMHINRSMVA